MGWCMATNDCCAFLAFKQLFRRWNGASVGNFKSPFALCAKPLGGTQPRPPFLWIETDIDFMPESWNVMSVSLICVKITINMHMQKTWWHYWWLWRWHWMISVRALQRWRQHKQHDRRQRSSTLLLSWTVRFWRSAWRVAQAVADWSQRFAEVCGLIWFTTCRMSNVESEFNIAHFRQKTFNVQDTVVLGKQECLQRLFVSVSCKFQIPNVFGQLSSRQSS